MRLNRILATVGLMLAATTGAEAHPHVFIDARSEVVFDHQGRISAVRNIWQFDPAFTAYAIQGLDIDNDGQLSDAELEPLAKVNVESLEEFDFFTYLSAGERRFRFVPPEEYWLEFYGGRLTLFFTLPVAEPVPVGEGATLEVFDPEYFVAFAFFEDDPVAAVDAPAGCDVVYHPPAELDSAVAAILGAIPSSQRELPPELQSLTADLGNTITVECR